MSNFVEVFMSGAYPMQDHIFLLYNQKSSPRIFLTISGKLNIHTK